MGRMLTAQNACALAENLRQRTSPSGGDGWIEIRFGPRAAVIEGWHRQRAVRPHYYQQSVKNSIRPAFHWSDRAETAVHDEMIASGNTGPRNRVADSLQSRHDAFRFNSRRGLASNTASRNRSSI